MRPEIVVVEAPSEADREAVRAPLKAFNEAVVGPYAVEKVAILLKDGAGDADGGLWAVIAFGWMFVDLLAVPERWRGQDLGTGLMMEAEAIARRRACRGIWLSTFAFQARGLYEKLGFAVFGSIEDHPIGSRTFFMSKTL